MRRYLVPNMNKVLLTLCAVFMFVTACNNKKETAISQAKPSVQKVPFSLSIVPETSRGERFGSSIEMAHDKPREFYVVLTNVSMESQPVWEYWNSWGYQTLSFEFTTSDGKKILVSKRPQEFTKNFPSTFLILPGEHQVYPIRLDKDWDTGPKLSEAAETAITVKAIYQVSSSSESKRYKVWSGRVESGSYSFTVGRQWTRTPSPNKRLQRTRSKWSLSVVE